jgi:hypothetical protein
MKMEERITLREASAILGIHEQCIRQMMQRKEIDIGFCVPTGKRNHNYYIFREKVMKLVGKGKE